MQVERVWLLAVSIFHKDLFVLGFQELTGKTLRQVSVTAPSSLIYLMGQEFQVRNLSGLRAFSLVSQICYLLNYL